MDYDLKWTIRGKIELKRVVAYIAEDNPFAASDFYERVILTSQQLTHAPLSGRVYRSKHPCFDLRELIIGNYRLVYRVVAKERKVEVLSIFHGARQAPLFT